MYIVYRKKLSLHISEFPGKESELSEVRMYIGREKFGNLQDGRREKDMIFQTSSKQKTTLDLNETFTRKIAENPIRKGMWELRDCRRKTRVFQEWPQTTEQYRSDR